MKSKILLILCFCLLGSLLSAQVSPLVFSPALSPDGQQIAFSYQGDIWTVPAKGGQAIRLTIHEGYDGNPLWSPDGKNIAFQSDRFGNKDIFVIPAKGGTPQRLTYHSANDELLSWDGNDALLFNTRRYFAQVEREAEVYRVSLSGATPSRLLDALALDAIYAPNKKVMVLVRGNCQLDRETYNGPANRNLWLFYPEKGEYLQLTKHEAQDFNPKWGSNQTLYYLSGKSGKYNIHKTEFSKEQKSLGGEIQITNEKDFGIFSFDISADGKTIVYHKANELYLLSTETKRLEKVKIEIATDYRFDPVVKKSFSNMEEYSISPNGKRIAFAVHGEIFVTSNDKENSRTVRLTHSAARDREPTWLNDQVLLFRSDQGGANYQLYAISSADDKEMDLFESMKFKITQLSTSKLDEKDLTVSPTGDKIAFTRGRGELWVASIDSMGVLSNEKRLLNGWASPEGLSWSPDGRWLAYALDDLDFNQEVFIHAANDSLPPVNISMHPRSDGNPVWSKDGSKLAFTSMRNNGDNDIWFVWLKEADYFKTKEEWKREELAEADSKKDKKDKDKKKEVVPIQIDFQNIHERLVQVTAFPSNESNLQISNDGKTFYYVSRRDGRRDFVVEQALYSIKWDGTEHKELVDGKIAPYALSISEDGESIYYLSKGGVLQKLKIKDAKSEVRPVFAKMEIDYSAELKQIFNEGWRALDAGFYDPQFHGRDWTKLRAKYEPLALMASTKEDFQYIFNAMLGQLDASHMGLYQGDNPKSTQRTRSGLIGAELQAMNRGVKITRIVQGSPAAKPESKLEVGEIILSVNQKEINKNVNFYALMDETAGDRLLLEVEGLNGAVREVYIWPVASLSNELYEDWVRERKMLTEKYSKGKLGYIHIQGMDWGSFERFERELMAAGYGKEGIVIDVRYNGGGWTTDYLMAVLTVKQHSYTVPRGAAENLTKDNSKFKDYYPYGERLPLSAWTKPSIAMCNENSFSNAEIFAHAYKALGLGTLVGKPTFGAVISTGGYTLMDGSYVRMPFRAWFVKNSGLNMEHGPAVPNVVVELSPDYKGKGIDEQLEKAVELLLKK